MRCGACLKQRGTRSRGVEMRRHPPTWKTRYWDRSSANVWPRCRRLIWKHIRSVAGWRSRTTSLLPACRQAARLARSRGCWKCSSQHSWPCWGHQTPRGFNARGFLRTPAPASLNGTCSAGPCRNRVATGSPVSQEPRHPRSSWQRVSWPTTSRGMRSSMLGWTGSCVTDCCPKYRLKRGRTVISIYRFRCFIDFQPRARFLWCQGGGRIRQGWTSNSNRNHHVQGRCLPLRHWRLTWKPTVSASGKSAAHATDRPAFFTMSVAGPTWMWPWPTWGSESTLRHWW